MHYLLAGYKPDDIEVVAAFDIDSRKVGADIAEAAMAKPNCTKNLINTLPHTGIKVSMGKILDGVAPHMQHYPEDNRFVVSNQAEPDQKQVIKILKDSGAEIMVNYLPVGSSQASYFYANCALYAGLGFVNNIPVFIASDPEWESRFRAHNLPVIGDDIKSQLGATIVHRCLMELCEQRGVKVLRTYQLNTGGNTDFLNMLDKNRLATKKLSKTESVQSVLAERLEDNNIHIGPSDYVPWQKDNKVAFMRIEGEIFGEVPINLELRLSVEDSPNSAGVAIDAIRCCKLALDRGLGGAIIAPSAYFCKHPPQNLLDHQAKDLLECYINQA